jgi:hypothetical protein
MDAWKSEFETTGYHEVRVTVARKLELIVKNIIPHDLEEFAAFDVG